MIKGYCPRRQRRSFLSWLGRVRRGITVGMARRDLRENYRDLVEEAIASAVVGGFVVVENVGKKQILRPV